MTIQNDGGRGKTIWEKDCDTAEMNVTFTVGTGGL
jgi:hypothetical protein